MRVVYGKDMEKDVVDDTSGHFRRLLVAQIQGGRDESKTFDRTAAQDDAQALFKAGEGKWGTDESTCALTFVNSLPFVLFFFKFSNWRAFGRVHTSTWG